MSNLKLSEMGMFRVRSKNTAIDKMLLEESSADNKNENSPINTPYVKTPYVRTPYVKTPYVKGRALKT